MLNIAIIGAGRIGKVHALAVFNNPNTHISHIYDIYAPAANELAQQYNAIAISSLDEIFNNDEIHAVIIASTTDTHLDLLLRSVKANKPVLCEKPLDLDINKITKALPELKLYQTPVQIGFNRRFDPNHRKLKESIVNGDIGNLEQLIITSRDPSLPDLNYVKQSGGIFRDMIIHDFDMARYITGEDIIEVQAFGSCLVDKKLEELDDLDSVMIILKSESERLIHINGSRHCSYGYDQRIEAFGSSGMLMSNNPTQTSVTHYTSHLNGSADKLYSFFLDRYENAYKFQLENFANNQHNLSPSLSDGVKAQQLAEAAIKSLKDKAIVTL